MAVYKGQYIFEGRGRGWTEVWYWLGSTGTLDTQGARFLDTLESRRLCLGSEYAFKGIRVSEELNDAAEPVLNDSWLQRKEQSGYTLEPGWEEDLALVINCQNASRSKRRHVFMRGLWDGIENFGGQYIRNWNTWETKINAWRAKMLALGAGWITRIPSAKITVVTAVQNDNNGVTFTLAADLFTVPAGGYKPLRLNVRTQGTKSVLSGVQIVLPTGLRTADTVKPLAIFPQATTGWQANIFTLAFQGATFIEDSHVTRRPTGSPLLESVGRARARARG